MYIAIHEVVEGLSELSWDFFQEYSRAIDFTVHARDLPELTFSMRSSKGLPAGCSEAFQIYFNST